VDTLEYSGVLDDFGLLQLVEEQGGRVCRFDGTFSESDGFSSFCGTYTDSTKQELDVGNFDFKVDFPQNIQGVTRPIEEAIEESRKGPKPQKWFPGSMMLSPGKYGTATNADLHRAFDKSTGAFTYSPKAACKQAKKKISYETWNENKKEQIKRDKKHQMLLESAIEEAEEARMKEILAMRAEREKKVTEKEKGGEEGEDGVEGEEGEGGEGGEGGGQEETKEETPKKEEEKNEVGKEGNEGQEEANDEKEEGEDKIPIKKKKSSPKRGHPFLMHTKEKEKKPASPYKKDKVFGHNYTPPLGTLHSPVYLVPPTSKVDAEAQMPPQKGHEIYDAPKYRNGLFLESYNEACLDVPMEPIQSVVMQLKEAIEENEDIENLHIEYCAEELKDLEVRAVALSLRYLEYLKSFRLAGSRVRHFGARFVAESLPQLRNLRTLEISDSCIKDDGCIALCHALIDCPNLITLNLSNCLIEDTGADALGQFLTAHDKLERLLLGCDQHRNVTDDSLWGEDPRKYDLKGSEQDSNAWSYAKYVEVLQQAFAEIRLVRSVVPKGHQFPFSNLIGPAGAAEIAKGIASSESITSVDLLGNPIGSEGIAAICETLAQKDSFREICFSCWDEDTRTPTLDAEALNSMMAALSKNPEIELVDMGSVLLLKELPELKRPWSRLTQPKRESEDGGVTVPKRADGLSWGPSGKPAPFRAKMGRSTSQNWRPPTREAKEDKHKHEGPISADLFFKNPSLAQKVYPDLSQAEYMRQHYVKIKAEVAQVLQGERYIPQCDNERVAIAGKISRIDAELAKAKMRLEEEEDRDEEADQVIIKALVKEVEYWERAVSTAVDSYYWQQQKKEAAEEEKKRTGWAPSPFRKNDHQQETHVSFGTSVRWTASAHNNRKKIQSRRMRKEEEDSESEDEEDGTMDPLLQTALEWEHEIVAKEKQEREMRQWKEKLQREKSGGSPSPSPSMSP